MPFASSTASRLVTYLQVSPDRLDCLISAMEAIEQFDNSSNAITYNIQYVILIEEQLDYLDQLAVAERALAAAAIPGLGTEVPEATESTDETETDSSIETTSSSLTTSAQAEIIMLQEIATLRASGYQKVKLGETLEVQFTTDSEAIESAQVASRQELEKQQFTAIATIANYMETFGFFLNTQGSLIRG